MGEEGEGVVNVHTFGSACMLDTSSLPSMAAAEARSGICVVYVNNANMYTTSTYTGVPCYGKLPSTLVRELCDELALLRVPEQHPVRFKLFFLRNIKTHTVHRCLSRQAW